MPKKGHSRVYTYFPSFQFCNSEEVIKPQALVAFEERLNGLPEDVRPVFVVYRRTDRTIVVPCATVLPGTPGCAKVAGVLQAMSPEVVAA